VSQLVWGRSEQNPLRRPVAARTIARYRPKAQRSDVTVTAIPQEGEPAPVGLEFVATLLPLWRFPPGIGIAPVGEQGTNNRTLLVRHGQQGYVLPVKGSCPSRRSAPSTGSYGGYGRAALPSRCPSPAQVIHGDLAPLNVLADPDTDEVIGLLDFELAGADFRVQDILAALYKSTALGTRCGAPRRWLDQFPPRQIGQAEVVCRASG